MIPYEISHTNFIFHILILYNLIKYMMINKEFLGLEPTTINYERKNYILTVSLL